MRLSVWMVLAALLMPPAEAATYAVALDVDALSARSESVLRGEVSRLESQAGGPGIETAVTIRVEETLLGTPVPEVHLTVPGGRLGGRSLTVPGAPRLIEGQEVVVFLDAESRLVGFGQGLFTVQAGHALRVTAASASASAGEEVDGEEVVEVISLADLRRAVR